MSHHHECTHRRFIESCGHDTFTGLNDRDIKTWAKRTVRKYLAQTGCTPTHEQKEGEEEVMDATGQKHDTKKPRWDLLPWEAQSQIVDVLTFGAEKYGPDNWRDLPFARRRYAAAAFRHIVAWLKGERQDPESGLHRLAHAACFILFLLEMDTNEH